MKKSLVLAGFIGLFLLIGSIIFVAADFTAEWVEVEADGSKKYCAIQCGPEGVGQEGGVCVPSECEDVDGSGITGGLKIEQYSIYGNFMGFISYPCSQSFITNVYNKYYCCCSNDFDGECSRDLDCSSPTPVCDLSTFECVECLSDSDCPSGTPVCENKVCIEVCIPDCTGKSCGDDGCGGSCGLCPTGHNCIDGQCIEPPSTDDIIMVISSETNAHGALWTELDYDPISYSNIFGWNYVAPNPHITGGPVVKLSADTNAHAQIPAPVCKGIVKECDEYSHGEETECNSQLGCYYNTSGWDECERTAVKCEDINDSTNCNAQVGCTWQTAGSAYSVDVK
jgi:Cys-rich repeat protein